MEDVRESIVGAAARILAAEGVRGVTTRAVAQAAGVQAPTIYRLFGDKDGLIDAVAEHVMATYVAAKSSPPDGDPVDDLRAGWRAHIEFGLANPGLYALLLNPERQSPATAAGVAVLRARVRRLATAGLLRVEESLAVSMIHAAGSGTILALLGSPGDRRLADAMFSAVCGRILADAPVAAVDGGARAVAVTFATVVPDLPGLTDAERELMGEWVRRSLGHM